MSVIIVNAWQMIFKAGPMIWPILLLSIIALGVAINRLSVLRKMEARLRLDQDKLQQSLKAGKIKDTLQLCESMRSPLSNILKAGVLNFGSTKEVLTAAMEKEAYDAARHLKKDIPILAFIVNAAPLMGLLGTVNAMVLVFHSVQVRSNALNPLSAGDLSTGIWHALLTTSAGMAVGLFSYALYSFCAVRINEAVAELERFVHQAAFLLVQLAQSRQSAYDKDID